MDKIIVTTFCVSLIGFIYWFFFGKKEVAAEGYEGIIPVLVSGGYKPGVIKLRTNEKMTLEFTRQDTNTCLEEIVIPDFGIRQYLPMHQKVTITITPEHKGEYDIHCGMNMFHGKIIVQ